jgi:hypothetical protein
MNVTGRREITEDQVEEITYPFDWEDLTGSFLLNELAGILDTEKVGNHH